MSIIIYTDGACLGNPGVGGWGVVILDNKKIIEIHGGSDQATNNQMELKAAIEGLKYFAHKKSITLFTDSKYVKDGISSWIDKWKINGWKTANKKSVKNKQLWQDLDYQIKKHEVNFKWIKGHTGEKYNERADMLARKYIDDFAD